MALGEGWLRRPIHVRSRRNSTLIALALLAIFMVSFALRARYPITRPSQWLVRTRNFVHAVVYHEWEDTFQRYHPAVTTMAVSGLTLRGYYKAAYEHEQGSLLFEPIYQFYEWVTPSNVTYYGRDMVDGVLGLALVIALTIVAISVVLARLSNWRLGLTAGGLLAFSPFFLAQSKVYHPDAMVSSFMILSGLLVLLYAETGRWRHLILSALVAGLAYLTKTPALFLIPYAGLVLSVSMLRAVIPAWREHGEGRVGWLAGEVWQWLAKPGLLWLIVSILPLGLWPAMWVSPIGTLQGVYAGLVEGTSVPHKNLRFFAGALTDSPGVLFYPGVLAYYSTFVTLTLFIVAILAYVLLWRKRRDQLPVSQMTFWLLIAYILFYWLQMSLSSKQDPRYILPATVAVVIIAAIGLAAAANLLEAAVSQIGGRGALWAGLLAATAVGVQALVVMPYAPDFGAYANHLLGGNRAALKMVEVDDQHDGILYAVDYLAERGAAEGRVIIGTTRRITLSLKQYLPNVHIVEATEPADYYLFTVVHQQRELQEKDWLETWQRFQDREPTLSVRFGGVEYLSVYAADPVADPNHIVINHAGRWLNVVAWVWILVLAGLLVWALLTLRRSPESAGQPSAASGMA